VAVETFGGAAVAGRALRLWIPFPPVKSRRVHELKQDYTIAIVTLAQQAAPLRRLHPYVYLGEMVEFGETRQIFFKPKVTTEDYRAVRRARCHCGHSSCRFFWRTSWAINTFFFKPVRRRTQLHLHQRAGDGRLIESRSHFSNGLCADQVWIQVSGQVLEAEQHH
jgi:hypothetical protein